MRLQRFALAVLVAACVHEFAWQALPAGLGLQGNMRNVTQWVLTCTLLAVFYQLARSRFVAAVCVAVALMSSTTAACSGWWLISRFDILPGREQCSKVWSLPMLMLSCVAALAVFWLWEDKET